MMTKKVVCGIILVVVVVAALSGFWFFKAATTYDAAGFGRFGKPLTPLPLFHISTNVSSADVLQGGSATIEVSIALRNLTGNPDTISLGLESPIGEVPPFVNATFEPDTITINAGERVNSTLTLKIDSSAPTGRYLLSAYGKSSTFGAHDKYEGAFICGSIGYSFDLNVIPASGEIPTEELPLYFYENGVRKPAPKPPTATPQVSQEQAKEIAESKFNEVKAQTEPVECEELWRNPKARIGTPSLVRTVDEKPFYWKVPVVLNEKVMGFVDVEMNGKVPRYGCRGCLYSPYYDPDNINNCSSTVTISTIEEAKEIAKNITDKYRDAVVSEPIYVYDDTGCCSGEAWMLKIEKDGKIISRAFVSGYYAYERK